MIPPQDKFIEHSLRTSMFFPQSRLFIAGNPKAAGTSLRWWLLPLHGIDIDFLCRDSIWGESAPFQTVWDPRIDFRYTWGNLSEQEQEIALTGTDILTVKPIRHPVGRAFSAWASKYLALEPNYNDRLPAEFDEPPGSVDSAGEIATMFESFMHSLADHVRQHPDWDDFDVHFWPQHRLLGRQPAGQTLFLRLDDMASGLEQIASQLRAAGMAPSPMLPTRPRQQ